MVIASIGGLPAFLGYFCVSLALVGLYATVYCLATAHNEFELIRQNVTAAAMALGLSLIGFALPLSSAIFHSANIVDCIIWGLLSLIVQIGIYWLVRLALPDLSQRIAAGEMAAAVFLGTASLAAGILSAASMSY